MPYRDLAERRGFQRGYQRTYMPAWRADNPRRARRINRRYERSQGGREKRRQYETKRKRPSWYADVRRMFDQLRSLAFPERGRKHEAARRGRRNATILTRREKRRMAKIYARAEELRQWFNVVVDHRIPLAKGGLHHPDNLQIIYLVENTRKGARLDYTPSVIFV